MLELLNFGEDIIKLLAKQLLLNNKVVPFHLVIQMPFLVGILTLMDIAYPLIAKVILYIILQ